MYEREIREILTEAVLKFIGNAECGSAINSVVNFEDTGLLTDNTGFILVCDAAEFQVTVIRSR